MRVHEYHVALLLNSGQSMYSMWIRVNVHEFAYRHSADGINLHQHGYVRQVWTHL